MRQIAFVLCNLVLQYKMIAKRVPCQLGDRAMILMSVVAEVCKHEIRDNRILQSLKEFLHVGRHEGKEAITKVLHDYVAVLAWGQQSVDAGAGLALAPWGRAEYNPMELCGRIALGKHRCRATATDVDVIAVRA